MLHDFEFHIRNQFPELFHQKVLIANSTGLDSMVLSHLLETLKIPFSVAYCNFQLRTEADQEEDFIAEWATQQKHPFFTKRFETKEYVQQHKLSIQMAAREIRYQWFQALALEEGFDVVLTAHHLNDQLETYLMHSFRGTGPKGLLGIPVVQGLVQRPLLPFTKVQLQTYATESQMRWCEDSSNATDEYQRNRIRHHVIPALEKEYPNWAASFQKTIAWTHQEQEFVRAQIAAWEDKHCQEDEKLKRYPLSELQAQSPLSFWVHNLFYDYGFEAKELLKLIDAEPGKALFSNSHRLQRERNELHLSTVAIPEPISISIASWEHFAQLDTGIQLSDSPLEEGSAKQAFLDPTTISFPLQLRTRQHGDYFYPTGMQGKKLVSKYFKDEKYSHQQKQQQLLLCKNTEVIWVVGKRCNRKYVQQTKSREGVLLTFAE